MFHVPITSPAIVNVTMIENQLQLDQQDNKGSGTIQSMKSKRGGCWPECTVRRDPNSHGDSQRVQT